MNPLIQLKLWQHLASEQRRRNSRRNSPRISPLIIITALIWLLALLAAFERLQ